MTGGARLQAGARAQQVRAKGWYGGISLSRHPVYA